MGAGRIAGSARRRNARSTPAAPVHDTRPRQAPVPEVLRRSLLDRGHLTLRQREIVIDRTTALCRTEYEWGVHVSVFADAAGLTDEQIRSLTVGGADDSCWNAADADLIRMCDALHASATLDDALWSRLRVHHTEEAMLELLLLAGFYRTTSYLVNALALPLEPGTARFADHGRA